MKIQVNQKVIKFDGHTVSELLEKQNKNQNEGFVVAVNKSIVLKSQWNLFKLSEGDSIFIIIPVDGG